MKSLEESAKSEQVAKQCDVVAHLATVLADLCRMRAEMIRAGHGLSLTNLTGQRTASQMEILGDMLNGMDAVDDSDAWTAPVFAEAQRLWPNAMRDEGWFCT